MKATGICPKCQGTEIYTDKYGPKRGDRCSIGFSSWGKGFLDTYICLGCGYVEEYLSTDDLNKDKKIKLIKENWRKFQSEM